jgi:hypothetical protein
MREPNIFGVQNIVFAVRWDTVAQSPASEISRVFVAELGIGRKDRSVIIGDERRITDSRNAKHNYLLRRRHAAYVRCRGVAIHTEISAILWRD